FDGVVDVPLLDQVPDDPLAVAALAVLAGQGEARRLGGLAGVEVPADQPLRGGTAGLVGAVRVPADPLPAAGLDAGDEQRQQRLALVGRLGDGKGHYARGRVRGVD